MPVQKKFCLNDTTGKDIYLFTLSNARGTEVVISNYGAIITSFKIKNNNGEFNDIVLGFDKIEDYWSDDYLKRYPWFGAAVGRNANRIANASFKLEGKEYQLTTNRPGNQLHGGLHGFDKKIWEVVDDGKEYDTFLELKYLSKDGEEGFPGNLETTIRFELSENDELSYEFKAICDKPTVVNLTHHSYFNLDNGESTINDHDIRIDASQMLEQDAHLVATGKILPVDNTPYDLRNFKKIADGLKEIGEYDKSFATDQQGFGLKAEARSSNSELTLQVYSTEPVVHFYSGKWTPVVKGKNGTMYGPFSGFCLETHIHPNAINVPHFPNVVLRPGEVYHQKTVYKIVVSHES